MKKLFFLIAFLLIANFAIAQDGNKPDVGLMGGIGAAFIENEDGEMEMWYNIQARPELRFGKLGVGLNLNLLYNPDPAEGEDSFRKEDLKPEKILWYISYGQKGNEPIYARVGALNNATLGHGFIVYNYNNQINENNPKLGLALDFNLEKFGVETMTSDLGRAAIFGIRPYFHPLKLAGSEVPILANLEVGASYIVDVDPDENTNTDDGISAFGFDIGLPIIQNPLLDLQLYGDWAKLSTTIETEDSLGNTKEEDIGGSGAALGTKLDFRGLGLVNLGVKVERRFMGEEFMPSYFNAFYEVDKGGGRVVDNMVPKAYMLEGIDESVNGTFGELSGTILQKFTLLGHYQYIDDTQKSGVLHLEANGNDVMPEKVPILTATYDKQGIEKFDELFELNENSIAAVDVGYKVNSYMILTVRYEWTFRWDEENEHLGTVEKITPGLQFSYDF